MKNVLYFLLLCMLPSTGSAQDVYTDFYVNGKFGLVKVDNLEEYLKPTYTDKVLFAKDYLGLRKDNELFFYNKRSGKLLRFLVPEGGYRIYGRDHILHVVKDRKSVLLDRNMNLVKTFPYLYTTIVYPYWSRSLIAKSKDGYDTYDVLQSYKLVNQRIKATDYFVANLKQGNDIFSFSVVFYGKDQVIIYNNGFQLLKIIPGKANSIAAATELLKPFFAVEFPDSTGLDASTSGMPWNIKHTENGYRFYENMNYWGIQLKIKDVFNIRNHNEYGMIMASSDKDNNTYAFSVNIGKKKALIPLKYQQLMGLEVLKE